MKIIVIGAGPGGYEAAIMAAKLGAEVTVVEKNLPGGTCLNRGCIPTKALLATADALDIMHNAKQFGLTLNEKAEADFKAVMERKNKVVSGLVKGIEFLFKANNVTMVKGVGSLVDKNTVEVTAEDGQTQTLTGDKIILATGSVPVIPKMFEYDGQTVISSDEVLELEEVPESLIIVGGGVIGCEIGQFLKRMGCQITIVEMEKQLLPLEDDETAKQLARQFKKEKIKVITGNGIKGVEVTGSGVTATLSDDKIVEAQKMLVAIGRRSFCDQLNASAIGIEMDDRGRIIVNDKMETSVAGVYAIGDIVASPFLAHVASKEGIVAVYNAVKSADKQISYKAVPRCVYTDPEVASVGLTEKDCQAQGIEYKIGQFDFRALGKAQAMGKIQGFVKVIVDSDDVIIGAAVVGAHATDLLSELSLAVHAGLTAELVGDVIHAHPTLSEAIMEALHDVHGVSVHKG
ncbi:dihydrolipoyl dehydrogenase [Eubacteriaceae bacterium ES3]|nr:dihydrolipoyl dehydrogenase [Eubacteriaceae bacterium ES3]